MAPVRPSTYVYIYIRRWTERAHPHERAPCSGQSHTVPSSRLGKTPSAGRENAGGGCTLVAFVRARKCLLRREADAAAARVCGVSRLLLARWPATRRISTPLSPPASTAPTSSFRWPTSGAVQRAANRQRGRCRRRRDSARRPQPWARRCTASRAASSGFRSWPPSPACSTTRRSRSAT